MHVMIIELEMIWLKIIEKYDPMSVRQCVVGNMTGIYTECML